MDGWQRRSSRFSYLQDTPRLIKKRRLYIAPILAGEAIRSSVLGEVVYSNSDKWKQGDIIFGDGEWAEYSVVLDHGPLTGKQMSVLHLASHQSFALTAETFPATLRTSLLPFLV
jgi:NADPH-dependent curcumin reductase CurA